MHEQTSVMCEAHQQRQETSSRIVGPHHLLTGLSAELVPNPIECSKLLIARPAKVQVAHVDVGGKYIHSQGELVEVDWHGSSYSGLPDIEMVNNNRVRRWLCKCPRMTIDEMRQLNLKKPNKNHDNNVLSLIDDIANAPNAHKHHQLPNGACQLRESGCKMTRKKLMRLVGLARKFKRLKRGSTGSYVNSDKQQGLIGSLYSDCLYELESLTNDLNSWLASLLDRIARHDSEQLLLTLDTASKGCTNISLDALDDNKCDHTDWVGSNLIPSSSLPIGARFLPEVASNGKHGRQDKVSDSSFKPYATRSSRTRRLMTSSERNSSDLSEDSGISLIVNLASTDDATDNSILSNGRRAPQLGIANKLEHCLRFRSSRAFQRIIAYSCELFQALLGKNSLLHLKLVQNNDNVPPVSLNQLRLFACVECQKLRATLRFEWLAKCLWLAFDDEKSKPLVLDRKKSKLPAIQPGDDQSEYLEALARLMAHLLRRHFLEEALNLWIRAIRQQLVVKINVSSAKLVVPVDLEDNGRGLEASSPDNLLRDALYFVCDELASVCSKLPRLECQLYQQKLDELLDVDEKLDIVTLSQGDSLLADKKEELTRSIEVIGLSRDSWLSDEYRQIIEVINKFRSGDADEHNESVDDDLESERKVDLIGLEICNSKDRQEDHVEVSSFVSELKHDCRKIKLLDKLEFRLRCQLKTEFYFGQLIQLDLKSLNERLVKIVDKERLLLTRFKSDELIKLMEKLRLQFDELEINIDIETAIEDYLNERWQVKQTQQLNLEQQILLDNDDDDGGNPDFLQVAGDFEEATDEHEDVRPVYSGEQHQTAQTKLNYEEQEEDEFLNALVSNNNPNVAHLFAMSNPGGSVPPEQEKQLGGAIGQGGRRAASVAPLVECRLLLDRYKYLNRFAREELKAFVQDLKFILSAGLDFLCEIVPRASAQGENQQLEPDQLELLTEISLRTKEFSLMLSEALKRLEQTRRRLVESASMRASVLSRTILEFNWLMMKLAQRRLEPLSPEGGSGDTNIKQLDFIQETSSWSQRLEMRLDFLGAQNDLLKRELSLLLVECQRELGEFTARLPGALPEGDPVGTTFLSENNFSSYEREFEVRADALDLWRSYTKHVNRFWRVLEEFETQQVKWLNSDAKKLEYAQVASAFELNFSRRLEELHADVAAASHGRAAEVQGDRYKVLLENIEELRQRLERFRRVCLPLFKFLTNRHLTQEHWQRLGELLLASNSGGGGGGGGTQVNLLAPGQVYTTVAQLLEQFCAGEGQQQLVSQLDEMSHQATMEHELSQLIASEVARSKRASQSLKSQLKSLEVCSHLDSWSERELTMAASRFIKMKLSDATVVGQHRRAVDIDRLARRLVACHSTVRRYLRLSGHLNLDLASRDRRRKSGPLNLSAGKPGKQVVVLRQPARQQQQVGASLLIEFLRLFTETWLESEAKLSIKFTKISDKLARSEQHLAEIDELLEKVKSLQETDLDVATREAERRLAQLQRDSIQMELEREILATRESAALERQREALRARDICVRQISERAIPALRAARRALDCLGDGKSLRALRSYRPSPPMAVRLVIEAVCLLRNVCCSTSEASDLSNFASSSSNSSRPERVLRSNTPAIVYPTSPKRRFDSLRGQIVEDYWPIAWRTLNGIHSSQLLADLRQVSKRTIPRETMYMIRRKYLSKPEFNVASIGRISRQAALLARWLIAVDVFDRVLSIVRPNYEAYLKSEENLGELLASVTQSRQQIDALGQTLDQLEESIRVQVKQRATLVDRIDDCLERSSQLEVTRNELLGQIISLRHELDDLQEKIDRVAQRCLWNNARLVYLDAMPDSEQISISLIIKGALSS